MVISACLDLAFRQGDCMSIKKRIAILGAIVSLTAGGAPAYAQHGGGHGPQSRGGHGATAGHGGRTAGHATRVAGHGVTRVVRAPLGVAPSHGGLARYAPGHRASGVALGVGLGLGVAVGFVGHRDPYYAAYGHGGYGYPVPAYPYPPPGYGYPVSAYGYPPAGYGYPAPGYPDPAYGYGARPGGLRIQGISRGSEVYVDGYFAGIVDNFDGVFQHLDLAPGPHEIEIRSAGAPPIVFDILAQPGRVVTYRAPRYRR